MYLIVERYVMRLFRALAVHVFPFVNCVNLQRRRLNGYRLNGNSVFFRVEEKVITLSNLILMHGFLLFLNTHTLYKQVKECDHLVSTGRLIITNVIKGMLSSLLPCGGFLAHFPFKQNRKEGGRDKENISKEHGSVESIVSGSLRPVLQLNRGMS